MVKWTNLDKLDNYQKLLKSTKRVDIKSVLSGADAASRVAQYTIPMAEGLNYNYAAMPVAMRSWLTLQSWQRKLSLPTSSKRSTTALLLTPERTVSSFII